MRTRRTLALALVAVALSAAGCAAAFQQPEVRFEGVRLGAIGLRGGVLYAQVHVTNPNRFAFQTQSMTYDLELAAQDGDTQRWVRLAEGTYNDPVRVAARGSEIVEIPIEFSFTQLDGALRSVLDRGSVNYRVSGQLRLVEPIGRTVPFSRTGMVSMAGIR
jgi:LEA14-like dessication related protein